MSDEPTHTRAAILKDPELRSRLRAWAEPLYGGPIPDGDGPGSLGALQRVIEDAATASGSIPRYRRHDA
jgi:hypothetical protein